MAELGNGRRAPLLTKELYERRARMIVKFRSHHEDPTHVDFNNDAKLKRQLSDHARNVLERSVLTDLPYFDIVKHTLLDMMHITSGLMGRSMIALVKHGKYKKYAGHTGEPIPTKRNAPVCPPLVGSDANRLRIHNKHRQEFLKWDDHRKECTALGKVGAAHVRFFASSAERDDLQTAYTRIQAPPNIAPATKQPFGAVSGEMTSYHWVNFVKVYGKYLFVHMYSRPQDTVDGRNLPLEAMCKLIDLLTSCLASDATAELKVDTARQVTDFATRFDEYFPVTNNSIMMHALVHHIPETIRLWGPARGFWCFPFER